MKSLLFFKHVLPIKMEGKVKKRFPIEFRVDKSAWKSKKMLLTGVKCMNLRGSTTKSHNI